MTINCPKCKTDNPSDSKYCKECATPLPSSEEISVTETLETPKEELTTGSTFAGRYQIIEELGKGGMGNVYRVLDKELKEEIALKLIKPEIASDKKTLERFNNELKLARKIIHKNVGRMYELMEDKGTRFITMEYVPGEDLKSFIRRVGQLPVGKAISITKQVCGGLAEAHRLGVVHRDLKPSNIMIDKEGNARIMDFGIARSLKAKGITGTGVMIGTPEYISPEQVEVKEVDQRSDIYAVGVILYEMVTGMVPFEGETPLSIAVKHKTEVPRDPKELNTQIPEDLSRVILRCMEKDKEKRYQSAEEVRSELTKIEKGIPTTERVVPKRKPITSKEITVTFGLKKLFFPAVIVIAIAIVGVIIWKLLPHKEAVPLLSGKPSIAVLPFADLSPQKDQGYLCDGFAESLINALTKIKDLRVPAKTSSFSFKGKERDIQEIGEKLSVKTILEGSLQKAGNRIRITAQLINIADESLLWSEQYNRELNDVFAIQDEISLAIVDRLRIELLGDERLKLTKHYTENVEAYNLYLQGRFFWNKRTEEGIRRASKLFEEALKVDSNYALAYAGLADCYIMTSDYWYIPFKEAMLRAKNVVTKALEIDEALSEAHTSLAYIKLQYDWDWEGARREFEQAIQLNPYYASAHQWYANCLTILGRHDESIAEAERARELDPLSPIINRNVGRRLYLARKYDQAINESLKALNIAPDFFPIHWTLGLSYLQKGMFSEAIEELQKAVSLSGGNLDTTALLGHAYAVSGNQAKAQKILNGLKERSKESYVPSIAVAVIYVGLGDRENAINWLEKAYEERSNWLIYLKTNPIYDSVRSDPRFKALLEKMNLE